jgi:hypothetical protein
VVFVGGFAAFLGGVAGFAGRTRPKQNILYGSFSAAFTKNVAKA